MPTIAPVRPSPIAGRWYEGDPKKLADKIDRLLAGASCQYWKARLWG